MAENKFSAERLSFNAALTQVKQFIDACKILSENFEIIQRTTQVFFFFDIYVSTFHSAMF